MWRSESSVGVCVRLKSQWKQLMAINILSGDLRVLLVSVLGLKAVEAISAKVISNGMRFVGMFAVYVDDK